MIGALARYAANRAVHGVTDNLVRRASWVGAAALLAIVGLVTLVMVSFWWLQRSFSAETAGLIVAGVCFGLAVMAAFVPSMMEKAEANTTTDGAQDAVATIKEEAKEAVDYIGPMRLVASAFMVGIGFGRRLKQR